MYVQANNFFRFQFSFYRRVEIHPNGGDVSHERYKKNHNNYAFLMRSMFFLKQTCYQQLERMKQNIVVEKIGK